MGSTGCGRHACMRVTGGRRSLRAGRGRSSAPAAALVAAPSPSREAGRPTPPRIPRRRRRPAGRSGARACRPAPAISSSERGRVPVGVVRGHGDERGAGAGAARNPGSASALPWCGTLSTSAHRSIPLVLSRASASAPRSPVGGPGRPDDGGPHDQRQVVGLRGGRGPLRLGREDLQHHERRPPSCPPAPGPVRSAPAPPVGRRRRGRGRRPGRGPVATVPTARPSSAPVSPPTWSASRCDRSTSGSTLDPQPSRQRSTATMSGPASTSTASPAVPVGSDQGVALPHVAGDDHGVRQRPAPDGLAHRPADQGPARSAPPRRAGGVAGSATAPNRAAQEDRQRAAPTGRRASRAPRRAAPLHARRPGRASGSASRRTGPGRRRTGGTTAPTTVASSPSTVAGATAGAASRLAGSDTRLTVPESAATSGAVASPAAALTARASATQRPARRARNRRDQAGASSTMAAVASTERANPGSRASPGRGGAGRTPPQPVPAPATRGRPAASASRVTAPMAAARSTLGLGTGEDDEAHERRRRRGPPGPAVHRPSAQGPEDRRDHDRDVGAGHRGEVGRARPSEVLVQYRVHRAACPRRRGPGAARPAAGRGRAGRRR